MLQKQTITIPLGLGVNTKTDEKLVEAGKFNLVAENVTYEKIGTAKKRGGYAPLATQYYDRSQALGSSALDIDAMSVPPSCLAANKSSAILRNKTGQYMYLHGDSFVLNNNSKIPECRVETIPLYPGKTSVNLTDTDYDSSENIVLALARDAHPQGSGNTIAGMGSTLVLYNLDTKSVVTTEQIAGLVTSANMGDCRCGFTRVGGVSYYYNVLVNSDSTLQINIYNKHGQKSSTSYSVSGIQNNPGAGGVALSICRSSDDQNFYIIANTTTAGTVKFIALSGTTKTYETTFSFTGSWNTAYAQYSGGKIHVFHGWSSVKKVILNPDGTVSTADAAYTSGGLGIFADQDNLGRLFINSASASSSYSYYNGTILNDENPATFAISDKVTIGGVEIIMAEDIPNDPSGSTYFVLGVANGSGHSGQKLIAALDPEVAVRGTQDINHERHGARFAKISSTKAVIALPFAYAKQGATFLYSMKLVVLTIDPDAIQYSRTGIGPNLYFAGGFLAEFDGENLVENGFMSIQNAPTLVASAAGSNTGTFSYVTVRKYIDKNGQVTRSAPSRATSTGAISGKKVVVTAAPTPFGVKPGKCIVEYYRTTNGGSTYYYVGELAQNMYGTMSDFTDDNNSDTTISTNRILYTAGDVLQNDPAPACSGVFQGGDRVFLVGLPDENEIAYSKTKLFGESVNFSDDFRIRIDTSQYNIDGGVKAGGYMDGKIIAFKSGSVFAFVGQGPLETGADNNFTEPDLVTAEAGTENQRSVVLTPKGLMFKSSKGFYLINRGLSLEYVGQGVEEFNSYDVTSAVHIVDKNHVVFTLKDADTSNKHVLVYDYYTEQWSDSTGIRAIDSDVLNGEHVVLDSTLNLPLVQNGSGYLDNGSVFSSKIKTPWIKVTGIQDFGRIWSALILGKYKDAHTLTVKVRYNYDESYVETFTFNPQSSDAQYQYRCKLRKQKCQAVQFEIYDSSQTGESMELTALTLEVGVRKGSAKVAAGRKA